MADFATRQAADGRWYTQEEFREYYQNGYSNESFLNSRGAEVLQKTSSYAHPASQVLQSTGNSFRASFQNAACRKTAYCVRRPTGTQEQWRRHFLFLARNV